MRYPIRLYLIYHIRYKITPSSSNNPKAFTLLLTTWFIDYTETQQYFFLRLFCLWCLSVRRFACSPYVILHLQQLTDAFDPMQFTQGLKRSH